MLLYGIWVYWKVVVIYIISIMTIIISNRFIFIDLIVNNNQFINVAKIVLRIQALKKF